MSSTMLDTDSLPTWAVETRTSLGEQNATKVNPLSPRACSCHHFQLQMEILAEAMLMACMEEEVESWTMVVLEEYSQVSEVETDEASEVATEWTEAAFVEEEKVVLGGLLDH